MPHLVVREPGRVTFSLPVRETLRVGRHERSDLVLSGTQVSRHHAEIAADAEGVRVTDSGSTHGTLVNGEKVASRCLHESDRIQIGNALLVFHVADEPEQIVHQQITEAAPPSRGDKADRRLKLFYELGHAIGALGDTDELL